MPEQDLNDKRITDAFAKRSFGSNFRQTMFAFENWRSAIRQRKRWVDDYPAKKVAEHEVPAL